jgi:hypothetical protein
MNNMWPKLKIEALSERPSAVHVKTVIRMSKETNVSNITGGLVDQKTVVFIRTTYVVGTVQIYSDGSESYLTKLIASTQEDADRLYDNLVKNNGDTNRTEKIKEYELNTKKD